MKFFIVSALILGLVAAQDDKVPEGRTRICKEGEFPGKRVKRQAGEAPGPDAPKPCWFIPDDTIKSGDDCEKSSHAATCEKSQVFVPLGVLKVCIKFEAAPKWFLSEGTNGYCGQDQCCEWYPKETDKVVFCSPKRPLLKWYELEAGQTECKSVADKEKKAKIGVEIVKGKAGEEKDVCLVVEEPEKDVAYINAPAKLTSTCGGGCCIFELKKPSS